VRENHGQMAGVSPLLGRRRAAFDGRARPAARARAADVASALDRALDRHSKRHAVRGTTESTMTRGRLDSSDIEILRDELGAFLQEDETKSESEADSPGGRLRNAGAAVRVRQSVGRPRSASRRTGPSN
jgi:hypothetical protein